MSLSLKLSLVASLALLVWAKPAPAPPTPCANLPPPAISQNHGWDPFVASIARPGLPESTAICNDPPWERASVKAMNATVTQLYEWGAPQCPTFDSQPECFTVYENEDMYTIACNTGDKTITGVDRADIGARVQAVRNWCGNYTDDGKAYNSGYATFYQDSRLKDLMVLVVGTAPGTG